MRVERALRLLPPLADFDPLRRILLASAAPDAGTRWGSAAPFLTLGKWTLSLDRFREEVPELLRRTAEHLEALCQAYADALESESQGDAPGTVEHLLRAAHMEEGAGRFSAAERWADAALSVAEGLTTRRVEVEALLVLGDLCRAEAQYLAAGRHYQRALTLAQAEFDQGGEVEASMRIGFVALAEGELPGAALWLGRAAELATSAEMPERRARAERALAETARRQGAMESAEAWLRAARETFAATGNSLELARTLDAQGLLDHELGRSGHAQGAFAEALAWERRATRDPGLECGIHLHLAELHFAAGRDGNAEEEMRLAEQVAITRHLPRQLVQVYTRMGSSHGRRGAETGFVFFEQALALCHLLEPAPALEAEVCLQYAQFKALLGRGDEARGWLERARELLVASGGGAKLKVIDAQLRQSAG